jgi:hypothetical protein
MGGFDTHDNQNMNQADLLARDLARHRLLRHVMSNIGGVDMRNNVTLFHRVRLRPHADTNGDGTDHGWGGHHFVVGGAVNGARSTAASRSFQLNAGPTRRTTPCFRAPRSIRSARRSVVVRRQPTDLDTIFPNLKNFPRTSAS